MNEQDYNPYLPGGPGSRLRDRPGPAGGSDAADGPGPGDGPGLADFLPDTSSGFRAMAGSSLAGATGPADEFAVEAALKSVHDPEIPVNIFDLGLIYDVDRRQDGDVYITMSLTAPGCPSPAKCRAGGRGCCRCGRCWCCHCRAGLGACLEPGTDE
jgi:hypothetical protein